MDHMTDYFYLRASFVARLGRIADAYAWNASYPYRKGAIKRLLDSLRPKIARLGKLMLVMQPQQQKQLTSVRECCRRASLVLFEHLREISSSPHTWAASADRFALSLDDLVEPFFLSSSSSSSFTPFLI